uniref:Uncharacterized protein n=1 Tax=Oryza rufipogon TaxID=4529 RepID=A0A0E0PXR3_ORYRU
MKFPASSHREQPWLSSVYASPAAIGGSNRFEHKRENVENVLAHPPVVVVRAMVVCSPWNMSYSGGVSRVLTKQRNGGSEVQGVAETVVVGQRRQNSGIDVAGSTQGANCNFESMGVLGMSHRGCMREESDRNSPDLGVASVVRNGGRSGVGCSGGRRRGRCPPRARQIGPRAKGVRVTFHRREERGTHWGCTTTTAKSPEPGKMAELWAFCACGVFSWTWNASVGSVLLLPEEWSGGLREREVAGALIVFLGHPLGMGDGGCCEGRVGGCHVGPRGCGAHCQ